MKKTVCSVLAAFVALSMAACGSPVSQPAGDNAEVPVADSAEVLAGDSADSPAGDSKKSPTADSAESLAGDHSASSAVDEDSPVALAVGDVILADGSVVKGADFTTVDSNNAPIAVIAGFQESGAAYGIGVHRSDTPLQWAPEDSIGFKTDFADTACVQESDFRFSGDVDGSDNWEAICALDGEDTEDAAAKYPAFHFVNTYAERYGLTGAYASGWYLPGIAELFNIYQNREVIDRSLQRIYESDAEAAMDGLGTNWYWSSSQAGAQEEYAWFVHYYNGYAGECPKDFTNVHVLALHGF